jgi:hypothetical protein
MEHEVTPLHRIFNVLGWFAFVLMAPLVLSLFGLQGPRTFLQESFGYAGTPQFFLIVFSSLMILRLFFGTDRGLAPLFLSYLVGFALLATVAGFPFLHGYADAVTSVVLFESTSFNFLAGLLAFLVGVVLSYVRGLSIITLIVGVIVLPAALLAIGNLTSLIALAAAIP